MNQQVFFAEPVRVSDLRHGGVYFMLNYFDDEMLVPDLKTLVYIGQDLKETTHGMLYFQDYDTFAEWGAFPNPNDGSGTVVRCMADNINCIFELDKAIRILQQCQQRRVRQSESDFG